MADDPDYLCALAVCLNDVHPPRHSVVDPPLPKGDFKNAVVLDAFAQLLVHEGRDQVVAIRAGLNAGHIELYVSENTVSSSLAVEHLGNICKQLIDIRATIEASPNRATILDAISKRDHILKDGDDTEPAFASLHALRRSLIRHSIGRIQARFTKLNWPEKVDHVLANIKGPPANTRNDLSSGGLDALGLLQRSDIIQRSVDTFTRAVGLIRQSIEKGSDYDVDEVHKACMVLDHLGRRIPAALMVRFDQFLHAYAVRTHHPLQKPPNIAKWLRKVSFVIADYLVLSKILTTPALSALFGDNVAIHSVLNRPPKRAFVTNLEIEMITTTFAGLGFNVVNFKNIQDLIGAVHRVANTTKIKHVHCECALLCRLEQRGQAMLPYIGVSKLSCVSCDMFFACHRSIKGSEVRTRGTHGRATAWMWPNLPDDDPIRVRFCDKLRQYLTQRLEDAQRRWKPSSSSQSTTAFDDLEDERVIDDFDKAFGIIVSDRFS
ncbi:hypothetical protein C2E23DRAFT_788670 [Lenzites betulinus]|nr:hypothetical protein C2E23DRAFT_788670 [Lenzites betulinus]